jgi:hypothetical protein
VLVWPSEREALAVWADELQARGDRLGELIATSMRAEQMSASRSDPAGDPQRVLEPDEATDIARAAETARLDAIEQLLGPAIGELPRLRLRWQLGVVRGLYLDTMRGPHPSPQLVLEVVGKLLRRPVLRFLDDLHLEALVPDTGIERALFDQLNSPEVVARPRRIVLGPMPLSFRQQLPMRRRLVPLQRWNVPPESLESATARGLIWYGIWGHVLTLPWAAGDHGSRLQQLERLLARPWTDALAAPIAASVWDTSLAIRRRTLEALPSLPDALARALPSVLALDLHGARVFGDAAQSCAARIAAERPRWVASLAETFSLHEPWVAVWLAGLGNRSQPAARIAIPRIRAMIRRLSKTEHRPYHIASLTRALDNFGEPGPVELEAPSDDETIAELLTKLGKHRGL